MANETIPTLSVRDPWARAIFYLGKDVENRSWPTRYCGDFLIHTSKKAEDDDDLLCMFTGAKQFAFRRLLKDNPSHAGCIIGVVTLERVCLTYRSAWAQHGCYHWILANPRPLPEPISWRGLQGLFRVPVDAIPGCHWNSVTRSLRM